MTRVVSPTNYHCRYCKDHLWNSESEKNGPVDSVRRDFFNIYIFQLKKNDVIY